MSAWANRYYRGKQRVAPPQKETILGQGTNSNGERDKGPPSRANQPGWVQGLRQLYDATLHEPLPPSFEELLRKLDEGKKGP